MFGAIVYSLFNAGSWKLMLGFGIISMFFIMRSGQGFIFWSRWVSAFPSSNDITIPESIKIELANTSLNQRENKRDSILTILRFHKHLFNVVFSIFFSMIIVGLYLLTEYDGLFDRICLVGSTIFFSFGLWWWCKKTYSSEQRNEIKYSLRTLSKSDWEENPVFKSIERGKEVLETFDDYWICNEMSLSDIITFINREQIYFENSNGKWMLVQGSRGNSEKKNLAGFIKALIELKYLKGSLCKLEKNAQHLKKVFLIKEIKSGKELQEFHGANFQELNRKYVEFFKEKLREISTQSTPE